MKMVRFDEYIEAEGGSRFALAPRAVAYMGYEGQSGNGIRHGVARAVAGQRLELRIGGTWRFHG